MVGDDGFDEGGGGFEAAGDDAGIVDVIVVLAPYRGGDQLAEILDEGVGVSSKGISLLSCLDMAGEFYAETGECRRAIPR